MSSNREEETAVRDAILAIVERTIAVEARNLAQMSSSLLEGNVLEAIYAIGSADRVFVQGVGTSGALASYMAVRLLRRGVRAVASDATGIRVADFLVTMRSSDVLLVTSRADGHREVDQAIAHARACGAKAFVVTDLVKGELSRTVALVLLDMLASGVAVHNRSRAEDTTETLNALREQLAGRRMDLTGALRDLDQVPAHP